MLNPVKRVSVFDESYINPFTLEVTLWEKYIKDKNCLTSAKRIPNAKLGIVLVLSHSSR